MLRIVYGFTPFYRQRLSFYRTNKTLSQKALSCFSTCHRHMLISIHSLFQRETNSPLSLAATILFQSTPSCRGRRFCHLIHIFTRFISIHSLLQRETTIPPINILFTNSISIHSLLQRETDELADSIVRESFQSTPSCRGRQ